MAPQPDPGASAPVEKPLTRRLAAGIALVTLLGILLRLTVRDRWLYVSAIYYALPLPVLSLFATLAALLFRRGGDRRSMRVGFTVATGLIVWCAISTIGPGPDRNGAGESSRILCWNIRHGLLGWDRIAETIQQMDPDMAALVEAGEWSKERRQFWKSAFPEHDVSLLGGRVVCLTRDESGAGIAGRLPGGGQYRQLDVAVAQGRLTILIVDLKSDPLQSRQPPLERLAEIAEQLDDRPLVILGDFNTPPDSIHFAPLRRNHRHAFETAGTGYQPTWPLPVPVLCLDHVWVNRHVRVQSCRNGWTQASDHRPVVADVSILRPGDGAAGHP